MLSVCLEWVVFSVFNRFNEHVSCFIVGSVHAAIRYFVIIIIVTGGKCQCWHCMLAVDLYMKLFALCLSSYYMLICYYCLCCRHVSCRYALQLCLFLRMQCIVTTVLKMQKLLNVAVRRKALDATLWDVISCCLASFCFRYTIYLPVPVKHGPYSPLTQNDWKRSIWSANACLLYTSPSPRD